MVTRFMQKTSVFVFICVCVFTITCFAKSNESVYAVSAQEINTSSYLVSSRVAPGELLPLTVKLLNFGSNKKVDVTITYQVIDSNGDVRVTQTETVAVQTTASFIKYIQLPYSLTPGEYIATSSILYDGQQVPATSNFTFTIENKIAGLFVSQAITYGEFTLAVALFFAIVARFIIRARNSRLRIHDYSKIQKPARMFYEIISDTISQMHSSVGDKAYEMASTIEGLYIDRDNGEVLRITKDPSEIISVLLIRYETTFGRKLGITARDEDKEIAKKLLPVESNMSEIEKFFVKKGKK